MDLTQIKLTDSEWNAIEIPPPSQEVKIMRMIMDGYTNLDICVNNTQTLLGFLKMEQTDKMDDYLFHKFLLPKFQEGCGGLGNSLCQYFIVKLKLGSQKSIQLKSADKIRLLNAEALLQAEMGEGQGQGEGKNKDEVNIFELFLISQICDCIVKKDVYAARTAASKDEEEDSEEEDSEEEDSDDEDEKDKCKDKQWTYHYYTLAKMHENINQMHKLNYIVKKLLKLVLDVYRNDFNPRQIIFRASEYVEQNKALLKYKNEQLYSHQKELFAYIQQPGPKLILYIAPTGTGKTLSPIGINKKIIFVCAARHVGLALARTAIAVDKKIAFAFGASCAEDVRLHYAAASEYTRNRKSGKIQRVDNTKGEKVEIMICDIKSYIPAMYYMLAFNAKEDIVMYWDEVTISMDYQSHPLHDLIQNVWAKNVIPNVVFSSATMPAMDDLGELRASFCQKFPDGAIHSIHSFDCVKSISMIDPEGRVVLPHTLCEDYGELQQMVQYWKNNGTILRYFDAAEVSRFIRFVETILHNVRENYFECADEDGCDDEDLELQLSKIVKRGGRISTHFDDAKEVSMTSIKQQYMRLLENITPQAWPKIYHQCRSCGNRIVANDAASAGVYITTKDAYTLTDGPTYFFTKDVGKIARFYVQKSNIPATIMDEIMEKIDYNIKINKAVEELEQTMESILKENEGGGDNDDGKGGKSSSSSNNTSKDPMKNPKVKALQSQIEGLRAKIKSAKLHDLFVPNKLDHLNHNADPRRLRKNTLYFTSSISDDIVVQIMQLHGIDDVHKILLLMGIGVFSERENETLNPTYLEIMKKLASQQKLYLIIANADYMWGTNYQACHAYFSKDLNLTQDKILQGMGRVGRGNIQQEYTVRFRHMDQIRTLLNAVLPEDKLEVVNMNRLFAPLDDNDDCV